MVFAINPTANRTFDQFLANAKALATNGTGATAVSPAPTTYSIGGGGATPVSTGTSPSRPSHPVHAKLRPDLPGATDVASSSSTADATTSSASRTALSSLFGLGLVLVSVLFA